jgi:lysozyme family protein
MAGINLTSALRDEYQSLFDGCTINGDRQAEVERLVDQLAANRGRYEQVGGALGIPWHFIAVIHNMESSQRFDCHLHNGDPLAARTVQYPPGRPKSGSPPFAWEQSAADALKLERLDRWDDWTLAGTLYKLEAYNGWGYRSYHPHVRSPYLWAGCNHYVSGKYVRDGRWSETAVSRQIGAAVLLRRMAERTLVDLAQHGVPAVVMHAIASEAPILHWADHGDVPYAQALQEFLNTLPGIYVKPDGWPGDKTSEAFRVAAGHYLHGDPRTGA